MSKQKVEVVCPDCNEQSTKTYRYPSGFYNRAKARGFNVYCEKCHLRRRAFTPASQEKRKNNPSWVAHIKRMVETRAERSYRTAILDAAELLQHHPQVFTITEFAHPNRIIRIRKFLGIEWKWNPQLRAYVWSERDKEIVRRLEECVLRTLD